MARRMIDGFEIATESEVTICIPSTGDEVTLSFSVIGEFRPPWGAGVNCFLEPGPIGPRTPPGTYNIGVDNLWGAAFDVTTAGDYTLYATRDISSDYANIHVSPEGGEGTWSCASFAGDRPEKLIKYAHVDRAPEPDGLAAGAFGVRPAVRVLTAEQELSWFKVVGPLESDQVQAQSCTLGNLQGDVTNEGERWSATFVNIPFDTYPLTVTMTDGSMETVGAIIGPLQ